MDIFVGVVVGLIVLMLLVVLHELGHFIAARRNGVSVLEFGIGFPPRAIAWKKDEKTGKWHRLPRSEWKKDKALKVVYSEAKKGYSNSYKSLAQKGMIFSLNWLPIGGFCQMDGESAADERPGTFGHAGFWQKTKILFGGVAMNWLAAIVIFTVLAWTGMPTFLEGQFTVGSDTRTDAKPVEIITVAEDSPASIAGILPGDRILAVGGEEMLYASEITDYNETHAGEEVVYTIERRDRQVIDDQACIDGPCPSVESVEIMELTPTLNPAGSEYLLGVTMATPEQLSYSTWSAPIVGVGLTAQITGQTFQGLGELVANLFKGAWSLFSFDDSVREEGKQAIETVGDSVSGPVGIIGVLFPAFTSAGPNNLAFLAAIISVSLACMNILPIPALDGGRWLLIAIYKLRRKKLTKEKEEKIVSRAFLILLGLMLVVTILDIARFF